jgi:hypothetical protein
MTHMRVDFRTTLRGTTRKKLDGAAGVAEDVAVVVALDVAVVVAAAVAADVDRVLVVALLRTRQPPIADGCTVRPATTTQCT